MKFWQLLSGYKTYVMVIGMIGSAVAEYTAGGMNITQLMEALFTALGIGGLRHGMSFRDVLPK
jgi:hypothetical protein